MLRYALIFDGSLRRGYAGDGYAEGGAADVVHAEFGTEFYAAGFASVFAADAYLKVGTCAATFLNTHLYELTYTFLVKYLEGIYLDYSVVFVEFEEFGCVVA